MSLSSTSPTDSRNRLSATLTSNRTSYTVISDNPLRRKDRRFVGVPASASCSQHLDQTGLPDAISTSSSTLVNLDSDTEVLPWEVASSLNITTSNSRASPLSSEGGTEATETPSPSPWAFQTLSQRSRGSERSLQASASTFRRPAYIDLNADQSNPSPWRVSNARLGTPEQAAPCPHDCHCSDQEIERGLCRCALNSSSSEPETDLKKEQAWARARFSPHKSYVKEQEQPVTMLDDSWDRSQSYSVAPLGGSLRHSTSSRKQNLSGWSGRDISEDPILVPKDFKQSPRPSTLKLSFSHLEPPGSEEEEEERHEASRLQSRLLGQWVRRTDRSSAAAEGHTLSDEAAPPKPKPFASAVRTASSLTRPPPATYESGSASFTVGRVTPIRDSKASRIRTTPQNAPTTAAKYAADRRSIAAVFEKMQAEREQRAREEEQAREEKRLQREREKAARALGWQRRRPSQGDEVVADRQTDQADGVNNSTFSSPASPPPQLHASSSAPSRPMEEPVVRNDSHSDGKPSEDEADTTARARALARVRHARLKRLSASPRSGDSTPTCAQDETPSKAQGSILKALKSTPSPKEERRRHLLEESTSETVSDQDDDYVRPGADSALVEDAPGEGDDADQPSMQPPASHQQGSRSSAPSQSSATPQLSSGFSFPSQSSPSASGSSIRSSSVLSSPASSLQKNAHRRQRTSVVSISKNLPASSETAAAQAMNRVLGPSTPSHQNRDLNIQGQEELPASIDDTPGTTRKDHLLDSGRRSRSVRFSLKPDYRSDSGTGEWGEVDGHGSPDETATRQPFGLRVVNRTPMDSNVSSANTSLEDVDDHATHNGSRQLEPPRTQISLPPIERALQLKDEAKTRIKQDSMPAPSTPNSFSMHLPGAYAQSPSVSRYMNRQSPKKQIGAPNGSIPRVLSPPLTLAASPPSVNMSPSQRQKLAASRGLQISPSNSATALIEEQEDLEDIGSKHFDESSLSLEQIRASRLLSPGAPRESTPPRLLTDSSLRLRSDNSSDPLSSPSPLRNEMILINPADDSVRETVERILAALKRKEQAEQPTSDEILAAIDQVGGQMREAVRQTAAELPRRLEAPSAAIQKALALEAAPANELDTSFVAKIDGLRERLTSLITGFGSKLYRPVYKQPAAGYSRTTILIAVAAQVVFMWMVLDAAQARSNHLYNTVYYDPFYPHIYQNQRSVLFSASLHHDGGILSFLINAILTILSSPLEILSYMIWRPQEHFGPNVVPV